MASLRPASGAALGVAIVAFGLLSSGDAALASVARLDAALGGRSYHGLVCEYRKTTGRPCIGCGGTTALMYAREGRFLESARANAFGFGVAAGLAVLTLGALAAAAVQRPRVLLASAGAAAGLALMGLTVQTFRWLVGSTW